MSRNGDHRSINQGVTLRLLCLVLVTLVVWPTCHCRSTATETLSQPAGNRKTLDQEIGSPSELAWQAWLLVENKHGPGQAGMLDSSNILRRITPKSIFIAPEVFCPDGYTTDGKGGCKIDPISLDEEAQRNFYLKKLNAKYQGSGSAAIGIKKKPQDLNGPLQINIPIFNSPNRQSSETQSVKQPQQQQQVDRLAIPVVISQRPIETSIKSQEPAMAVVVYKVENGTKPVDKDGPVLFLGNSSNAAGKKDGQVLQVAEIEMNETFSGVVDYKIPITLEPLNKSIADQIKTTGKKQDSAEDSSPTMVLLLSPTKPPFTTSSQSQKETDDYDRFSTRLEPESSTIQPTEADTRLETDSTIQTVAPLGMSSEPMDVTSGSSRTTEPAFTQEDESAYTDYSQTEQESEDEDETYDDRSTEPSDEFTEADDELLKPGEAGMMLSPKNQDIMKNRKQSTLPVDDLTSTTILETTTLTSLPTDSLDSTIRTEATDYTVREQDTTSEAPSTIISTTTESEDTTSTFETRPWRLRTTIRTIPPVTQAPVLTTIKIKEATELDGDLVTEPEVILSTQGSSFGRKKPAHPAKIHYDLTENLRTENPDLYRREPPATRPQLTINNEPIFFKDDEALPQEFRDQLAESSKPSDSRQSTSYVRFPEQEVRTPSRFRFPSDEVNSIHNQGSYKDHLISPYRSRDESSATSTKSSVPARQKPANNWRVPPGRMDRQQQGNQRQQKQKPMLLRFWARMPLVRDLSFYPTTSHGSHNEPIGGPQQQQEESGRRINSRFSSSAAPRRVNYYKEMASHDVNRRLAQQLGQPAIGG